jgi:hypothetical protein
MQRVSASAGSQLGSSTSSIHRLVAPRCKNLGIRAGTKMSGNSSGSMTVPQCEAILTRKIARDIKHMMEISTGNKKFWMRIFNHKNMVSGIMIGLEMASQEKNPKFSVRDFFVESINRAFDEMDVDQNTKETMIIKIFNQIMEMIHEKRAKDKKNKTDKADLNPLQPNNLETALLKFCNIWLDLKNKDTLEEWINIVRKFKFLQFLNSSGDDYTKKEKDYNQRAESIVGKWKKSNFRKTLVLMDGHGRILLRIMKELRKLGKVENFEIIVTDLEASVDAWHNEFCPRKFVRGVQKDIFEFVNNPTYLTYLNFCGISECLSMLETIGQPVYLSYSTARGANIYCRKEVCVKGCHEICVKDYHEKVNHMSEVILDKLPTGSQAKMVSLRSDFETWWVCPPASSASASSASSSSSSSSASSSSSSSSASSASSSASSSSSSSSASSSSSSVTRKRKTSSSNGEPDLKRFKKG